MVQGNTPLEPSHGSRKYPLEPCDRFKVQGNTPLFTNRIYYVQPCRIGEDGRPEPVGQVLELIEDISQQQIKTQRKED
jgi:hypothetical protein